MYRNVLHPHYMHPALPKAIQGLRATPDQRAANAPLPPRVVAVRGFVYLILEQLRAAPASSTGYSEPGPSQASGSQVGGKRDGLIRPPSSA